MSDRSYQPGFRKTAKKINKAGGGGTYAPSRWAWNKNELGQFVIHVEAPKETQHETGPNLRISYSIPGRPGMFFDLTRLNVEELESLRQLFETAFEWALPVCEARDKEAADAFADGDDSYARVYRQVPVVVYRTRPESEHGKSILDRFEDVPSVGKSDLDNNGGSVRGSGDDLAERDEEGGESQDDGATPHEPSSVRQVVGTPPPPVRLPPPHAG